MNRFLLCSCQRNFKFKQRCRQARTDSSSSGGGGGVEPPSGTLHHIPIEDRKARMLPTPVTGASLGEEDEPLTWWQLGLLLLITVVSVALMLITEETQNMADKKATTRRFEAPFFTVWVSNMFLACLLPLGLTLRRGRCTHALRKGGYSWGTFLRAAILLGILRHFAQYAWLSGLPDPSPVCFTAV